MENSFLSPLLFLRDQAQKYLQRWKGIGLRCPHVFQQVRFRVAPRGFRFECDGCGCMFVPTPDNFILTGAVRVVSLEAGSEMCAIGLEGTLTPTKLQGLSEFELGELGLTEEDRKALLAGNPVYTGAEAFCSDCLHQIFR